MYLSCLLVEDGIRHLFHINLTVSCLFSSYSLACVSAPSLTRHLRLWNHRPHRASSLISYLSYQSVLDDTPISQPLPLLHQHAPKCELHYAHWPTAQPPMAPTSKLPPLPHRAPPTGMEGSHPTHSQREKNVKPRSHTSST